MSVPLLPPTPSLRPPDPLLRPPDPRQPGSRPRWRLGVGAVSIAVVLLLCVGVALTALTGASGSTSSVPLAAGVSASATSRPSGAGGGQSGSSSGAGAAVAASVAPGVFVHVLGEVGHPGLYQVAAGARAVDVITAAGGFTGKADQGAVNLARTVSDGEQIVVPVAGASPSSAAGGDGAAADPAAKGAVGGDTPGAPVDLNVADAAALTGLPGVGPATAEAILAWRDEHGRFASIDDLLDVTGIGDKKLDRLRGLVTVSS